MQVNLNVQLVKYTPTPEEAVALGAKLCYSGASVADLCLSVATEEQSMFVDKLMNMGHMTPIEHASFTFAIEGVSRSLLAQITRHRIASFSVQSQRYVNLGDGTQIPGLDLSRVELLDDPSVFLRIDPTSINDENVFNYIVPPRIAALGQDAIDEYRYQMTTMQLWYTYWYYKLGATRDVQEDARFVLPNACETKILMTMNARELLHFFNERCCNRAQWEIRALATEMLHRVKFIAPTIFKKAGPKCVKLGFCPEGAMSCGKTSEVRKKFLEEFTV